jgi:hypothetical protein
MRPRLQTYYLSLLNSLVYIGFAAGKRDRENASHAAVTKYKQAPGLAV